MEIIHNELVEGIDIGFIEKVSVFVFSPYIYVYVLHCCTCKILINQDVILFVTFRIKSRASRRN